MKKILSMAIILFVSNSSLAITGQGFKIVDESIKSTPGFNFKVEESTAGNKKKWRSASARASAPNKEGWVGRYNQIDGYHSISISNSSHKAQTYEYTYTLDCEEAHGSYVRHVEVSPGGYFSTDDHSYGTVQKSSPGYFRITATTKLRGESDANDSSNGTLSIHK